MNRFGPRVQLRAVPPGERFDNTAFSNVYSDGTALPLTATYTCPRCGEGVRATKQHFERRAERRVTNLDAAYARAIDAWAKQEGYEPARYLDWPCPGCGLAVRVYAEWWYAGWGDMGVDLKVVVEAWRE
jgi:predicted RNA-binding Zn-ribbon protein involved in translation (DUF1610 family)